MSYIAIFDFADSGENIKMKNLIKRAKSVKRNTVKSRIKAHSVSNSKFTPFLSPPGYRPMGLYVVKRPQSRRKAIF